MSKRNAGTPVGLVTMTAPRHMPAELGAQAGGDWFNGLAKRRARLAAPPPTHCKQGHEYNETNVRRPGHRMQACPTCLAAFQARWRPMSAHEISDDQRGDPALARPRYDGPESGTCQDLPVEDVANLMIYGEIDRDGRVWYPPYRTVARRYGVSESKIARLCQGLGLMSRRSDAVASYRKSLER